MGKDTRIMPNTTFTVQKFGHDFEIMKDGTELYHVQKETKDELLNLLNHYVEVAKEKNQAIYCDYFQIRWFLYSRYQLIGSPKIFKNERISHMFSYLEEDMHFLSKTEDEQFYIYCFKDQNYGEIQEIYIKVPKDSKDHFRSSFKYTQMGIVVELNRNEYPNWMKTIKNKARKQTRELYRTARLFQ
jgi:hypothetical protein